MSFSRLSFSAIAILLVTAVGGAVAAPARYAVEALPIAPGCQSYTVLHGLNARGDVHGVMSCDDFVTQRAVLWEGEKVLELGTFGGPNSYPAGLDAKGDVVGYAEEPEIWAGDEHIARPFLYRAGEMLDIGTLGGPLGGALAINAAGTIVGASQPAQADPRIGREPIRPCMWLGGEVRDLGDLGGPEGYAYDVNSRGWIVGSSTTAELLPSGLGYVEHAFIHDGERMQDLGTLGGLGSIAWSLNEMGDVVGSSLTGEHLPNGNVPVKHAFLWSGGVLSDLGTLGGPFSEAVGVNNRGQIVGWSWLLAPNGNTLLHAALWDRGGIVDLNDAVEDRSWSLREARAIDERGRILVNATRESEWRVLLLTPLRSE